MKIYTSLRVAHTQKSVLQLYIIHSGGCFTIIRLSSCLSGFYLPAAAALSPLLRSSSSSKFMQHLLLSAEQYFCSGLLWHFCFCSGLLWHFHFYSGLLWHFCFYSGLLWHFFFCWTWFPAAGCRAQYVQHLFAEIYLHYYYHTQG